MTQRQKKSVGTVFALATLVLAAIGLGTFWDGAGAASTDPILVIHGPSLEAYKAIVASPKQNIFPRLENRGVGIDGALRRPSTFPMGIAGNRFASPDSVNVVRPLTGTYETTDIDIALPSKEFSWVVGRSYHARQNKASGHHDSIGYQGNNWFQMSHPEIVLYDAGDDNKDDDLVYLIYGADRYTAYKRATTASNEFIGVNGAAGVFVHNLVTNETYVLTDQNGIQYEFFGPNATGAVGQLWRITGNGTSNVAYVGHATTKATAIANGYNSGRIKEAYDTNGRKYVYDYTSGQLDSVVVTEGATEVARVEYTYHDGADSYGSSDDLKLVKIREFLDDPESSDVWRKKYYRYWKVGDALGTKHQIEMVLGFEGTRNFDYNFDPGGGPDNTFNESYLSESIDDNLKPYSEAYFQYDSISRRINLVILNGQCGCGGASSNGEYVYQYSPNGSFSNTVDTYDTAWKQRTVVVRPDDARDIYYYDEIGQPLSSVFSDVDPDTATNFWVTKVTRTPLESSAA